MSKESTNKETVYKDINVSEQTRKYISLKQEITKLYNHVYDVIVDGYSSSENLGNTIFCKHFADKFSSLEKEVDDFLIDSINQDIEEANN